MKDIVEMDNVFFDQGAITRSISHVPPTHYTVKINLFSLLAENDVEKYESGEFETGRYKWKLVVYPNGNKSKNVKDQISLYLAISNTSTLSSGWEVYAVFRLFLLDQYNDKFLILQDAKGRERRFHGLKLEWGFDQFIPLEDFKDASNGYLVEDTCVFGAEVFVKERNICKGESLSMIKDAKSFKHVWKIENFSKLDASFKESVVFSAGDHKWKIRLYPKGVVRVSGSHLSMFLVWAEKSFFTPDFKIYANFTMRILDLLHASHLIHTCTIWFGNAIENWGMPRFVELSKLNDPGSGYLGKDVCMVETEVKVLGISKPM